MSEAGNRLRDIIAKETKRWNDPSLIQDEYKAIFDDLLLEHLFSMSF